MEHRLLLLQPQYLSHSRLIFAIRIESRNLNRVDPVLSGSWRGQGHAQIMPLKQSSGCTVLLLVGFLAHFGLSTFTNGQVYEVAPPQLHLQRLYDDFYDVVHGDEIYELLSTRFEAGDKDVIRIVNYLNSSDFKSINDHLWRSNEFKMVKRSKSST